MKKISNTVKITGLLSICLWIIASIILFNEKNGKATIVITAVIIIAGLSSQIIKNGKVNSEH
jgi:multisubunit Na+/H+ antiporter MnhG subunit